MLLEQATVDAGASELDQARARNRTGRAAVGSRRAAPRWVGRYRLVLLVLDTALAAAAGAAVIAGRPSNASPSSPLFWACLSLIVVWPVLLASVGAYSERVFGTGSEEYRRVGRAGLRLLATVGFVSYAADLYLSRALVVVAIPLLTLLTLVSRNLARHQLSRLRVQGLCTKRVVLVGRGGAVLELAARLRRESHAGLEFVAACVTPGDRARVAAEADVPVGGLDEVAEMAARHGADAVAVTSASETASQYLRTLSWELEGSGLELLVAPGLIEVAGPRLHIRPYVGLPLLAVEEPQFEGWRRMVKGGMDRVVALAALLLLSPVLALIGLAVRLDSSGPALYRQERVGAHGQTFTMWKFRSMRTGADQQLAAVQDVNIGDGLLFKARRDPRVTRVGGWLRRLSLDELPQLVNVLSGSMSLVGPRPPLPSEVALYEDSVRRRLLVKPGLTGLWQISGRSDLSWEESVRLDLRYVENWSLALDLLILWKTASAVLGSRGAY